ncbi:MAG: class I SAM-dependent methyltransferase [Acidiphilium sp.]|nr:class I SAM-dependent methyltransferase [Acidiphilium sp.]MDD4935207.1 class I SAM-dependent methyltransferase [Acidiphilium sp.]
MSDETQATPPNQRLARLITRQAQKRHLASLWAEVAGLAQGMVVLDIGAGSGALTLEYAPIIGPAGQLIALEPDRECLDYIRTEAARRGIALHVLQGTAEALPSLPAPPDRVMLTDALHHINQPIVALRAIHAAMAPHGILFIAEYDPAGPGVVGAKLSRRTYPNDLAGMLIAAGFKISASANAPDEHYTMIATP